jgi:ADP-ribose pyrophosphatase YjhB (NUDIX family)
MKTSAGLVILYQNKILLVHPTNAAWYGTFSIPKGEIEDDEDILEAAIRETKEEIGIEFDKEEIGCESNHVNYVRNGKTYKRVYYFTINLNYPIDDSLFTLQQDEVDWVGFLNKEEAEKRISPRLKELLKYLN